jgi:O-antigen/teichoic acid export membrane protein
MSRFAFFRQSGWMTLSSGLAGILFSAVHNAASKMEQGEYGVYAILGLLVSQTSIPAVGLQLTFAQQTVHDLDAGRRAELASALRALFRGTLALGLLAAAGLWFFQKQLVTNYKISNPAALWVTLAAALVSLWTPMFLGVLQGRQNFLWFGWATMLNGLTRLLAVTVIVLGLGGKATGAMAGVLLGSLAACGIAVWQSRDLWDVPTVRFDWVAWLKRVLPITLGMGALTYMLTQDGIAVGRFFPASESDRYQAAGIIGRAVYFFTAPVTYVLFPKLVQSAVREERTSVLALVLGATCLLGGGMALACTFFPTLPLRILYPPSYLEVAQLVPVFGWCVLPLSLSTVLVNNLLARQRFVVVPWLVLVAAGYGFTLHQRHGSFEQVIHTLGFFGSLLFFVCVAFTWWTSRATTTQVAGAVSPK